jgi:YlmC/YmxH family sporulation protein
MFKTGVNINACKKNILNKLFRCAVCVQAQPAGGFMCRIEELCRKDVINVKDGCRLGFIDDVEIDVCDGRVVAIVIFGRARFFGLFGREEDIVIPWCSIQKIGEDTILVCFEPEIQTRCRPRKGFGKLFN